MTLLIMTKLWNDGDVRLQSWEDELHMKEMYTLYGGTLNRMKTKPCEVELHDFCIF